MMDMNSLLPLIQSMSGNNNSMDMDGLMKAMGGTKGMGAGAMGGLGNSNASMMQMLPMLMQMFQNKQTGTDINNQNANEPVITDELKPLEPIIGIADNDISDMLFKMMNKK